ncbi:MAG: DUF4097 family beta strand repeat protein [Candidatus Bathyarchaeota archaeon]|nr:MAG: DUF4097 family beta strand repeat protein [Candidatus Bathyarchaeota archaeon]
MSDNGRLGFGGVLVGLGLGWIIFNAINVTSGLFSWVMILSGSVLILSTLFFRGRETRNVKRLSNGLMIGLLVSLLVASGNNNFVGPVFSADLGAYRAQETRSFSGALTTGRVLLDVNSFNGLITVSTWDRQEYSITVLVKARGVTDADAEKNLDRFELDLDEGPLGGRTRLVLGHNTPQSWTSKYSLQVEARLPTGATVDLDLDSSNGAISLTDIRGGAVDLRTSNGRVDLDHVTAGRAEVSTSNGDVEGVLDAPDARVDTSNGGIELRLPCTVSGRYVLRTSNAAVDITVPDLSGVGYDVDASTSNAYVEIDLDGLVYSLNQKNSKEARTEGFVDRDVRITLEIETSNGGVKVGP